MRSEIRRIVSFKGASMKSLCTCLLLIATQPAFADERFEPLQMEDGSRLWRFVINGMAMPQDSYILDAIRLALGRSNFCPAGWEVTSREKKAMALTIAGKCVESAAASPTVSAGSDL
jgi:hypothetical protein